ncbi:SPOR domain-containing protein, partial [archaeon]|nr:SPOR domain-containing protein [archaeon]
MRGRRRAFHIIPVVIMLLVSLLLSQSCAPRWKTVHPYQERSRYRSQMATTVKKMGYTIQVGAFNRVDNAVRLTRSLEGEGLNAFYFPHKSGLYKVRFGNYATLGNARAEAERLKNLGIIDVFYIVNPSEYSISKESMLAQGGEALRNDLVSTARNYIVVPYQCGSCTVHGPV